MPMKFPKFSRRKTVGNSNDAAYEPANPSSHNFEAPPPPPPDLDEQYSGRQAYANAGAAPRQSHRSSGNTSGSAFSSEYHAGSNRLSSTSTLPSTDAPRTPDSYRPVSQLLDIGPQTPGKNGHPYGVNAKARPASTFHVLPASSSSSVNRLSLAPPQGQVSPPRRNTMMAVPQQLDLSLDPGASFGEDMFDFSGPKRNSRAGPGSLTPPTPKVASDRITPSPNPSPYENIPAPPKSYDPVSSPTAARFSSNPTGAYSNMYSNSHHMDNDASPYHYDPPPPPRDESGPNRSPRSSRNLTPGPTAPRPSHARQDSLTTPSMRPQSRQAPTSRGSDVLKRHSAVMRRQSMPMEDEDAAIVAGSARHGHEVRGPRPQTHHSTTFPPPARDVKRLSDNKGKDRDSGWEETIRSGSSSDNSLRADSSSAASSKETNMTSPVVSRATTELEIRQASSDSSNTTPKASFAPVRTNSDDAVDYDLSAAAALAAKYDSEDATPKPSQPSKVMTRAQFELLQQQQDEQRRLSGKIDDDDEESLVSSDGEESDTERNKEVLRQRAKQDAHLSVYRQQMMKITGSDEPTIGMQRPASMSTGALPLTSPPFASGASSVGKLSDSEEDEDVPLAILAAHGFPNKNRPPTRLSTLSSNSQPNLRAASQAGGLPVFARNLPADPYNVGASLMNPINRMSMGMGGDARSIAGGSMYGGMPPSELPGPKGLVGEIFRAEELKASRKSHQFSPQHADPFKPDPFQNRAGSGMGGGLVMNAGAGARGSMYNLGAGANASMGSQMGGMGGMGMGQMGQMGQQGGDAQMQMQHMQMMQMQMQMQMVQMMAQQQQGQQGQPFLQAPDGLAPPGGRPASILGPLGGPGPRQTSPRAMSMMNVPPPNMAGPQPGYTPSINPSALNAPGANNNGFLSAPGTAGGYTPSIAPSERSNIGLPSRYRPVSFAGGSQSGGRTSTMTSTGAAALLGKIPGPSHLQNRADSDDEDDEGWEALKKKRETKKKGKGGMLGSLNLHFSGSSSPAAATASD